MNILKSLFIRSKSLHVIFKGIFIFVILFSVSGNFAYSQEGGNNPGGGSQNSNDSNITLDFELNNPLAGSGVNTINDFVKRLLDIVLTIGVPIVAVFIILAGFKFVTARGNQAEISKAKDNLLYTMIGAAILLGAWVLANALGETVNELVTP